jgi:hypothetical protein
MYDFSKLTRPLEDHEIEWKIQTCGKTGEKIWAIIVPYVTARAVMNRFDECFGPLNWKVDYFFDEPKNGNLKHGVRCLLSVFDKEKNEWVTKSDGAEQTEIESYKGGISSALKRAAVSWGIGRELYEYDQVFAEIVDKNTKGANFGKTKDGTVFYWIHPNKKQQNTENERKDKVTQEHFNEIKKFMVENGIDSNELKNVLTNVFSVQRFSDLTLKQYEELRKFFIKQGIK